MKKLIKISALVVAGLLVTQACKNNFIDIKPKGTDLESNYYKNQTEAFNGLVAVYDVVGWQGDFVTRENAMSAGSDDHYAGGGSASDVSELQAISIWALTPANGPQGTLWSAGYSGVFRANTLLKKLPDVPMDDALKSRYISETKFLRAYFYFDLVRFFGNIPLITEPLSQADIYNVLQAKPELVYAQIEKDLKDAIADTNLPNTVTSTIDGGRITKGAAHALLGKVLLYEKKYAEAAAELALVNGTPGQLNATYGYKLLTNFGDLWKTNTKFNSESIMEITHSSKSAGSWDCISCTEGNVLNIMTAPRDYKTVAATAPDYISGYGFLPITQNLFDAIHYDPRNKATVLNMDSLQANGIATYNATSGYKNTGFLLEKFAGRVSDKTTGGGTTELNYPQNMYAIRLADTYLMEAEALIMGGGDLARAASLLTAVRTRAHNDGIVRPVVATMANVKSERRLELVGEGHRLPDLIRWGDAATVLASRGFTANKNELLPIPLNELDNTKLVQNPGY